MSRISPNPFGLVHKQASQFWQSRPWDNFAFQPGPRASGNTLNALIIPESWLDLNLGQTVVASENVVVGINENYGLGYSIKRRLPFPLTWKPARAGRFGCRWQDGPPVVE